MFTLLIMGSWFLLQSILSCRFQRLLISRKLERDFDGRPREKKQYLIHQRINLLLIGAVLLGLAFVPESRMYSVGIPPLALIFISILWCNKRNLGRFVPARIFTE